MPIPAVRLCKNAQVTVGPRSDDLVVLAAVARHRTFTAAGRELGLDHTTVARRLHALARALGGRLLVESPAGWELTPLGETASAAGRAVEAALAALGDPTASSVAHHLRGVVRVTAPEAFVIEVVAPAIAALARSHPDLACEIVSATRTTQQHGPSADLEVGVSRPRSRRVETQPLVEYRLGLFASASYLETGRPIETRADLREHSPVYYVDSVLQVADLDLLDQFFPRRRRVLSATSVHAQVALVAAGGGIGLLPTYVARQHADLVPILADEAIASLTYWQTGRPENLRRPEVTAVARAIADHAAQLTDG
jgi:DNA-binding transcriptional LysR family regulator